jgi:hypothetical protein
MNIDMSNLTIAVHFFEQTATMQYYFLFHFLTESAFFFFNIAGQ